MNTFKDSDKFYRGKDGDIYLNGDVNTYAGRVKRGISIGEWMVILDEHDYLQRKSSPLKNRQNTPVKPSVVYRKIPDVFIDTIYDNNYNSKKYSKIKKRSKRSTKQKTNYIKEGRKDKQIWYSFDCTIFDEDEDEHGTYGSIYQDIYNSEYDYDGNISESYNYTANIRKCCSNISDYTDAVREMELLNTCPDCGRQYVNCICLNDEGRCFECGRMPCFCIIGDYSLFKD